jgi:hypothetical protein
MVRIARAGLGARRSPPKGDEEVKVVRIDGRVPRERLPDRVLIAANQGNFALDRIADRNFGLALEGDHAVLQVALAGATMRPSPRTAAEPEILGPRATRAGALRSRALRKENECAVRGRCFFSQRRWS